jgi:fucose 4-O-acetylase-like acetyltransferase
MSDTDHAPGGRAVITASPSRIGWADYARGIAIVLVVYGHCFRGVQGAGLIPADSVLSSVDYVIYTFHMPLFFFVSGIFSARTPPLSGRPFWVGRVLGILWPYLLWMTVEMLLLYALPDITNAGAFTFGPGNYLFAPISPFWFLYALLFCLLFVHWLLPWGRLPMLAIACVVFVAGQTATAEIVRLTTWGLLYFALGAGWGAVVRGQAFARLVGAPVTLVICTAGALGFSLACLRLGIPNQLAVPAAVFGSGAVFCLAERLSRLAARVQVLRVISYFGRISLTVLVVHILGTAAARIVMGPVLGIRSEALLLLGGTLVGLGVPVALQVVSTRLRIAGLLGLPQLGARPAAR